MDIISPNKWSVKTETTEQEREKTQLQIKNEAERICTRRKDKAATLESQEKNLAEKKAQLDSFIQAIKSSLSFESNIEKRNEIERLCDELGNAVRKYQLKLVELKERFAKQKIRVLSFGSKSQGKSSFTKAYTCLSDTVIGVKPQGVNNDKTGTTTIIIHKAGVPADAPEIYVVFKRPEAILDTVNFCFKKLGMGHHYDDWASLYRVLENHEANNKQEIHEEIEGYIQKPNNTIDGLGSLKETLQWIFNPISDFSDVNSGNENYFDLNKGKRINLSDLPQYNDMTNETLQSFTSVAEIHIFVDLGHNEMFENIEICDTKGISIEAGGGEWEKELYRIIGQSDAVFSIQATGSPAIGKSDTEFYEDLNSEISKNPETLKDLNLKHFALINPWDGMVGEVPVTKGPVGLLKASNIVNTVYIGPLRDGVIYGGAKCILQDYVDYVIHDMMKKIVITTNQTDENLLRERESYITEIQNKKGKLVKLLFPYNDITCRNEDEIIRDAVGKWIIQIGIPEVEKGLDLIAKEANVPFTFFENGTQKTHEVNHTTNTSSEYDDFDVASITQNEDEEGIVNSNTPLEQIKYKISDIEDQKVKEGVFEIITGDPNFPSSLREKNNNEIVKEAILTLYRRIKQDIGKEKYLYHSDLKGSYDNIGAYIDEASKLISEEITENVNIRFAPDRDMPGSQTFRDKLFSHIWNTLKLDVLYQSYNGDILKKKDENEKKENARLEHWSIPYNLSAKTPSSPPILPPPSFVILKRYFDMQSDAFVFNESYGDVAVKEQDLIKAFQDAYLIYDIPTRYKLKRSEEHKWKTEMCQHLRADLQARERFSKELVELYRYACPNDFVHKLTLAGIIDEKMKEECKNQSRLLELRRQYQNLSNFSI